jgi:hypothetical protein
MDDKLTIFIAVTAAAVVLQMLILLGMYLTIRKLNALAKKQAEDLSSRLAPVLEDTKKLTAEVKSLLATTRPKLDVILDNVSAVSTTARDQTQKAEVALNAFMDRARLQAIRADEMLTRTLDKVEDTSSRVQHTVISPFKHLNGVLQGVGVALETLFQKSRQPKNGKHRDEMFI